MNLNNNSLVVILMLFYLHECTNSAFNNLEKKYHLVSQSFQVAKSLFDEGRTNYNRLKNRSLNAIDMFLDLVYIMNDEMAKELRTAIIKFYKIKYFHDFTNYAISTEEMIDIADHCLMDPVEKLEQIRSQFHSVMKNFEDVRNFNVVDKCANELPDEVAAAHCVLHQAVLFNETMQDSLVTIVEIKTRQHAQDMNATIYGVQKCLNDFVPNFFDQLLVDAYTSNCGYLKVVNASISDLIADKWRCNNTLMFPKKWSPLVKLLKDKKFHASEVALLNFDNQNYFRSALLLHNDYDLKKEMSSKKLKRKLHVRTVFRRNKSLLFNKKAEWIQGLQNVTQSGLDTQSGRKELLVTRSNKDKELLMSDHTHDKNLPRVVPKVFRPYLQRIIRTLENQNFTGDIENDSTNKNKVVLKVSRRKG